MSAENPQKLILALVIINIIIIINVSSAKKNYKQKKQKKKTHTHMYFSRHHLKPSISMREKFQNLSSFSRASIDAGLQS